MDVVSHSDVSYPNESAEYRAARNALLEAEVGLRSQIEKIAAMRRALPPGGKVTEEYEFEELVNGTTRTVKISELFESGKPSLIAYNFMFGPAWKNPCPMCTSLLDGLNGNAQHIRQRVNFVVIARAPIARVQAWADGRGWSNLRMLSSQKSTYNADYFSEKDEDDQYPMCHVFHKTDGVIRHHWAAESFFVPLEGLQTRHMDLMWPLWNMFDLTPEGRGSDWYPRPSYDH